MTNCHRPLPTPRRLLQPAQCRAASQNSSTSRHRPLCPPRGRRSIRSNDAAYGKPLQIRCPPRRGGEAGATKPLVKGLPSCPQEIPVQRSPQKYSPPTYWPIPGRLWHPILSIAHQSADAERHIETKKFQQAPNGSGSGPLFPQAKTFVPLRAWRHKDAQKLRL